MSAREEFNQLYNSDRMLEFVCKILVLLDRTDDFPIQFSTEEQQQAYYKQLAKKDFQGQFGQWDALRDELDQQIRTVRDDKPLLHTAIAELLFPFEAVSSILYPADNESEYTKESAEQLAKYRDLEVDYSIETGEEPDCHLLDELYYVMDNFVHILQGLFIKYGIKEDIFAYQQECGVVLTRAIDSWHISDLFDWPLVFIQNGLGGKEYLLPPVAASTDSTPSPKHTVIKTRNAFDALLRPHMLSFCHNAPAFCNLVKDDKKRTIYHFKGKAGALYAYICLRIADKLGLEDIPWAFINEVLQAPADSDYLKKEASRMRKPNAKLPKGHFDIDEIIHLHVNL